MTRVYLALYKGRKRGTSPRELWQRLMDWAVRIATRGQYSHCEIAVKHGFTDDYHCYSASLRDGGVRLKTMPLPADKWDLIPINQLDAYIDILNYFAQTRGKPYDFIGACGVILGIKGSLKKWFCSEWCAAALGVQYPDRYSPQELADWLGQPEKARQKS